MRSVRRVRPDDVEVVVALVYELADYEREQDACHLTADQLHAALFSEDAALFGHVVEQDGVVVGTALWFLNFSTWEGVHGIWLEDLYVTPAVRGAGCGRALLAELAALCVDRGYARLEWSVLDWNAPSIAFYRSIGAVGMEEWTTQRLVGPALVALADR